jgi:hypothetical protein
MVFTGLLDEGLFDMREHMTTLAELKPALEQPFPVEVVQFLLKDIRQEEGKWTCLAFPYCNKRVYEDRLNALAYGEWQTPHTAPSIHDNKLIIPATLILCGVTHTDYGEAFLTVPAKNGTSREDENSATEAYSQAFRRACSKFGLGRYLYNLGKLRLPYDPRYKALALTKEEQLAWVEKLYSKAGIRPLENPSRALPRPDTSPTPETKKGPAPVQEGPHALTPSGQPTNYPNDTFLDWVAQAVARDGQRIQGICDFYQVQALSQLNQGQRENLTLRLKRQKENEQQTVTAQP